MRKKRYCAIVDYLKPRADDGIEFRRSLAAHVLGHMPGASPAVRRRIETEASALDRTDGVAILLRPHDATRATHGGSR